MIRVPGKNGEGAVDLFGDDDAGELVRLSHFSEREEQVGALARLFGPAVGGADGKDDELAACVAFAAQPAGEILRGHLFAVFVEQNEERGGAGPLAFNRVPESVFGTKEWGFHAGLRRRGDAVEVNAHQVIEAFARARADGSDPDSHWMRSKSSLNMTSASVCNSLRRLPVGVRAIPAFPPGKLPVVQSPSTGWLASQAIPPIEGTDAMVTDALPHALRA